MAKASDNAFPSVLLAEQAAAPAAPAAGHARLYRGTDNSLYMVDEAGTSVEVGAGAGLNQVAAYKSADESVANNTLQNDNHLSFPIGASEVWAVEYRLFTAQQTNATPDLKMIPAGPAGCTVRYGVVGLATTVTGSEGDAHVQSHSTAAMQVGLATTTGSFVVVAALIENGVTAGTVDFTWAQQTTDAANPTTLLRGSYLVATQVA